MTIWLKLVGDLTLSILTCMQKLASRFSRLCPVIFHNRRMHAIYDSVMLNYVSNGKHLNDSLQIKHLKNAHIQYTKSVFLLYPTLAAKNGRIQDALCKHRMSGAYHENGSFWYSVHTEVWLNVVCQVNGCK